MADYSQKAIITAAGIEYYTYSKPIRINQKIQRIFKEKIKQVTIFEKPPTKFKSSISRTKNSVRRLIDSNPDLRGFVTITFAENLTDIKEGNKKFTAFIRKLYNIFPGFKYVAVIEFQKRGAIHYHMVCNLDFDYGSVGKPLTKNDIEIKKCISDFFSGLWQYGYCDYLKLYMANGSYLTKYITKESENFRMFGKRKYFFSHNLDRPLTITGQAAMIIWLKFRGFAQRVFDKQFYNHYNKCKTDYFHVTLSAVLPFNIMIQLIANDFL